MGEGNDAIRQHGAREHVKLGASGTHQSTGTSEVDEEPILQQMLRAKRQQGALTNKLDSTLNLKVQLSRGATKAVKFGSHRCGEEKKKT